MKQYETVFIATPVLSEAQMKEAVAKYVDYITKHGGEVVYEEDWGLKQLAYPIQHKTSGFYHLIEFKANPEFIGKLETQYHRDESSDSSQSLSTETQSLMLRREEPTSRLRLLQSQLRLQNNLRRKELWHRQTMHSRITKSVI